MRVKICGVTRLKDAAMAERAGASLIGTILVPESPRRVTLEDAAELANAISIPLAIVTAGLSADQAAHSAERAGAAVIQLHGDEPPEVLEGLRGRGDWELWKAVRVRSGRDVLAAAERYGPLVDLLLLDGWHPSKLGGSGTAFSWDEAASARAALDAGLRVGIAGGLGPDNVATAIARLRPDLVDVSSGVETEPGVKDEGRVRSFVSRAFASRAAGESV